MRHRVELAVGFALVIVAFIWAAIDATHAAEFVERWIPKWAEHRITPTFNLVVILAGFLLVGAGWLELRFGGHRHNSPSSAIVPGRAEANPQQTASPVLTQTASPLMTQNTYIDGKLVGEQKRDEAKEVRPRTKSNLKCLGYRPGRVKVDQNSDLISKDDRGEFGAIFVAFRNQSEADAHVALHNYVRAHILFKDVDGKELVDIPTGYWMDDSNDDVETISFPLDRTRFLLVAVETHDGWAAAWPESYNTGWGNATKVHAVPIPSTVEFVEISLTESTAKCLPTQRFRAVDDDHLGIALHAL